VDVGTNGGAAWARPGTPPGRSDTALVTSYAFNAAGWVETITDPRGIVSKTFYDALARTTKAVENYTDGVPTDSTNKTTEFTYDGSNHVRTVQADLPGGALQKTAFVYGVTTPGSGLNSNDVLAAVQRPDPSTGQPSGAYAETYTVSALGQVRTYT